MTTARILVVEDEAIVARDIQLQLQELGYLPVGHATRGEEAVELARTLRPDLVLMDIQLAGAMDGIAAAQAIREQTGVPVVFLTAFAGDDTLARAKRVQPHGYILKPFSERELRTVLELALYKCAAEARLQDAALHTQAILNHMADGVITLDARGVIESVNVAACALFGYTQTEMKDHNVSMLMHGPEQQRLRAYLRRYRGGEGPAAGSTSDITGRRKDGGIFPMTLALARIQRQGAAVFIASLRDVTQKRQLARELDQHRNHLEALIAVRTTELTEARQKADAANQAKSTFVAHLSPEIRTPMNAILGFTHLLKNGATTPVQRNGLAKIERAGLHMMAVINDVLDFTKVEAERVVLEDTDFHLPTLLDEVLSLVSELAQAKGLQVALLHCDAPHWLRGDPTRLRQALLNYVANAVKFTDEGSVGIGVTCTAGPPIHGDAATLCLRLEVSDTGIGIAADKLASLFKPFEQAHASTTRQYGGTGLGLAISAGLARLMGGEVGLRSEPGVGSTFWLTARVQPGQGALVAPGAPVASAEDDLRANHVGKRVLVVDDDPFNREIAGGLLESLGLIVEMAEDGFDAVSKAHGGFFDAVLMDVQMPLFNGLEATTRIRAMPGWEARPIIALTANAFSQDRQACLAAGMNDVLVKPVQPSQLYAALLKFWSPITATL